MTFDDAICISGTLASKAEAEQRKPKAQREQQVASSSSDEKKCNSFSRLLSEAISSVIFVSSTDMAWKKVLNLKLNQQSL
jgi:hypothetical protein